MSTSSSALSRIPIIGGAVGSLTGSKHQEQQRHLQNAVRPLPSARPRRLTLPLPETEQPAEDGMKPQTTNAQPQSAFFSMLPPEMRMNIYRHCFPLEKISIEKDERLRYVNWKPQKRGVLPLLLACRRVYSEATHLLYTRATFHFDNFDTIILFASSILPCRLTLIPRLSICWDCICHYIPTIRAPPPFDSYTWFKVWEVIGRMKGLRELRVRIWNGPKMSRQTEMEVFALLWGVTWCEVFELELPWAAVDEGHERAHEGAPFTVVRVHRSYDPEA